MRIIVVRHYKTINNECRRIMGWGDAPRAADWEADLKEVDGIFRARKLRFDAIFSSNLPRARKTALYYARKRGNPRRRAAPELNEVNYGELVHQTKEWAAERCPEYKTDPDFVFPGGESFRQMQRRSVELLLGLEAAHPNDTLLIVAHAGVIRGLISHFLDLDFAANLKRKVSHGYIGEFHIATGVCDFYDEAGRPSGFVSDGVVEVPLRRSPAGQPPDRMGDWRAAATPSAQTPSASVAPRLRSTA